MNRCLSFIDRAREPRQLAVAFEPGNEAEFFLSMEGQNPRTIFDYNRYIRPSKRRRRSYFKKSSGRIEYFSSIASLLTCHMDAGNGTNLL